MVTVIIWPVSVNHLIDITLVWKMSTAIRKRLYGALTDLVSGGGGVLKVVPGYVTKDSWVGGYRRVFDASQKMMLSAFLWFGAVGHQRGFVVGLVGGGGGVLKMVPGYVTKDSQYGRVFDTSQMMMSAVTWVGWKYHNLVCSCLVVCRRWMTWCATNWWGKMARCRCGQNAWLVEW